MTDHPTRANPELAGVLANCDEIRSAALASERTYTNKRGEEVTIGQPDFKAAVAAVRLKAELLGLLSKDDPKASENVTSEADGAISEASVKAKLKAVAKSA